MAQVRIGVVTNAAISRTKRSRHPKAAIVGESGARVVLPLAPPLTHDGLGSRYATFERVNAKPLSRRSGPELRIYSCTLIVVGRRETRSGTFVIDNQVSVEPDLQRLRHFGRTGERVQWRNMGPSEGGWFRVSQMTVNDLQRQHGTNASTVASVALTLTEATDAVTNVGPLTGGAKKTGGAVPKAAPEATQSYTVVSGDTLWKIAVKFYGDGALYPRIADANKIANANHISVGQKLTIPPKP